MGTGQTWNRALKACAVLCRDSVPEPVDSTATMVDSSLWLCLS